MQSSSIVSGKQPSPDTFSVGSQKTTTTSLTVDVTQQNATTSSIDNGISPFIIIIVVVVPILIVIMFINIDVV
jgi:hypothetical protein